MISVIYSTKENKDSHIEHIRKTSGIHKGIEVIQYINNGKYSLTEIYNKALKETTNNIVVFCHDDIIFETKNWGKKLLKLYEKNTEYGIIGIAGSREMPVSGKWWENVGIFSGKFKKCEEMLGKCREIVRTCWEHVGGIMEKIRIF